jgi:hypothetical protein
MSVYKKEGMGLPYSKIPPGGQGDRICRRTLCGGELCYGPAPGGWDGGMRDARGALRWKPRTGGKLPRLSKAVTGWGDFYRYFYVFFSVPIRFFLTLALPDKYFLK